MREALQILTPHLAVMRDNIHVGVLRDEDRVLLIDCGTGAVAETDVGHIETVLVTHHHRDQVCGIHRFPGAAVMTSAAERSLLAEADAVWNDPEFRWHLYNWRPHHTVVIEPAPVARGLRDGDTLEWGSARITALATPAHTDGSMSYLVEVDGKTVAFTGDLIYAPGQVWTVSDLQKGITTTDYHGFLGARPALLYSLERILAAKPAMLVPSHGEIMTNPAHAVGALRRQLRACYDDFVAISALRWYFPDMVAEYIDDPAGMPFSRTMPPAPCLRRVLTSWIIVSETGAAFVMDCATPRVIEELRTWQAAGEISGVEGMYVTHYHNDHTDALPAFQQAFDCPLIAVEPVAQVIADPLAWRLPCIVPSTARVDRRPRHGESWTWHEFTLTSYHFPGQTLHHGGLLVEGGGQRMFFSGDSFTPAGIDDYCAQNRNFLGAGVGYDACVALLQELKPEQIYNSHVEVAFTFTDDEYRFMRDNLAHRETTYGAVSPWDHANYALDEFWAYLAPYEQVVHAGETSVLELVVTNHSAIDHELQYRPVVPHTWGSDYPVATVTLPAKDVTRIPLAIPIPSVTPGRHVVTVDLEYQGHQLPQYAEAILVVEPTEK